MVGFYERLLRMEKDKALREAQLMVKKRCPHPFYWAAFQLTGLLPDILLSFKLG